MNYIPVTVENKYYTSSNNESIKTKTIIHLHLQDYSSSKINQINENFEKKEFEPQNKIHNAQSIINNIRNLKEEIKNNLQNMHHHVELGRQIVEINEQQNQFLKEFKRR